MNARFASLLIIALIPAVWASDSRPPEQVESEIQQVELWEAQLEECQSMSDREKWEALGLGLRNMGHRRSFPGHGRRVDETYRKLQQTLLSIPGHARWFTEEIERERKTVEHLPPGTGDRISYDRNRFRYMEILGHLPSPESVEVLGHYLSDNRDLAEIKPPVPGKPFEMVGAPGNSTCAAGALRKLGIRDAPLPLTNREFSVSAEHVAMWLDWWEEVKSGRKSFSFIGGDIEYRFGEDGKVQATVMANQPDDAPKPEPRRRPPPDPKSESGGIPTWLWMGIGGIALVGIGISAIRRWKSRIKSPQ